MIIIIRFGKVVDRLTVIITLTKENGLLIYPKYLNSTENMQVKLMRYLMIMCHMDAVVDVRKE